jgi:hypothetical protein
MSYSHFGDDYLRKNPQCTHNCRISSLPTTSSGRKQSTWSYRANRTSSFCPGDPILAARTPSSWVPCISTPVVADHSWTPTVRVSRCRAGLCLGLGPENLPFARRNERGELANRRPDRCQEVRRPIRRRHLQKWDTLRVFLWSSPILDGSKNQRSSKSVRAVLEMLKAVLPECLRTPVAFHSFQLWAEDTTARSSGRVARGNFTPAPSQNRT